MKNSLLITRPDYDEATFYLSAYSKKIIDFAEEKNLEVIDLKRPRLTAKNFSNMISSQNPSLVFFNAHGDEATIYGDKIGNEEEILVSEGNHDFLANRIIYARACWAAASLGRACVENGGAFIGYDAPFTFWTDDRWSAKPLNDNTARLFLEPSNMVVISLIKGNSAIEAHKKSIEMSKKNILELLKKEKEPGVLVSIKTLWSNIQSQKILGDVRMKLE